LRLLVDQAQRLVTEGAGGGIPDHEALPVERFPCAGPRRQRFLGTFVSNRAILDPYQ
jgi:hypothetical protein